MSHSAGMNENTVATSKRNSGSARLQESSAAIESYREDCRARARAVVEADARRLVTLLTDGAGLAKDELDAVLNMHIAKHNSSGTLADVLRLALAPPAAP